MTDVKTKTPNKRKSVPNQNQPTSAKKSKTNDLVKTPGKTPNKANKTPKKFANASPNKTPKTEVLKKGAKLNNGTPQKTPKKLQKFGGTGELEQPTKKVASPKQNADKVGKPKVKREGTGKKGQFAELKEKVKGGNKEIAKELEKKIQTIQNRPELTKSAKRKLSLLKKLKNEAEGKPPVVHTPAVKKSALSNASKRRQRRKNVLVKSSDGNVEKKATEPKGKAKKVKVQAKKEEESEDEVEGDDSEDEVEGEEEVASGEEEEGSDDEVEGSEEEDSDDEETPKIAEDSEADSDADESDEEASEEEEEDEEDNSSEEDTVIPQPKKNPLKLKEKPEKAKPNVKIHTDKEKRGPAEAKPVQNKKNKEINLEQLEKIDIVKKNQKRYVVFVGNIPYDATTLNLKQHFEKVGNVRHVRIPTDKKTNKPRGFAYVEVENEESYQKCLSMHHSTLNGRRINVLYTEGGKKKGEDQKKKIKAKNFKLHAMRREGQLAGSKKDSQKRSFRRSKKNNAQQSEDNE